MAQSRKILGLSLREINEHVKFWQGELRLRDWTVKAELVDPRAMENNAAQVSYNPDRKDATVEIATDCESIQELHDSIIHELLHLHFWFVKGETDTMIVEQAINSIAPIMAKLFLQ